MQLLVRVERPWKKLACGGIVLGLVAGNAAAAGWNFVQRMFVGADTIATGLGGADSRRAAAVGVLASGLLGMDGRSSRIRISFGGGFLDTVGS